MLLRVGRGGLCAVKDTATGRGLGWKVNVLSFSLPLLPEGLKVEKSLSLLIKELWILFLL
jgi:hypothetical protein